MSRNLQCCTSNLISNDNKVSRLPRRLFRANAETTYTQLCAMRRSGRMSEAIADTGRDLPRINVAEGEPFEMPSTYGRSSTEA